MTSGFPLWLKSAIVVTVKCPFENQGFEERFSYKTSPNPSLTGGGLNGYYQFVEV
jgi:hypothetical protein